ncbi:MAG: amino acid adenylation domain-containing protein [Acidobacteriota bacterium]
MSNVESTDDLRNGLAPAKLTPAKKVLLNRWLSGADRGSRFQTRIPRRDAAARIPLSSPQARIWFLEQLAPEQSAFNLARTVVWHGPLDPAALTAAARALVERHESLRTSFHAAGGKPHQRSHSRWTLRPAWIDLTALPPDLARRTARDLVGVEVARPFDLERPPLIRLSLLALDATTHVAVVTIHHLVADGWSLGILNRELATLYRVAKAGQPSPLPPLAIQYGDFACWHARGLERGEHRDSLTYWREQLGGELPLLELPTDRPRPALQRYRGGRHVFTVSPKVASDLISLGRRARSTPFMTALMVMSALLHRVTGQHDLLIGTPHAGRSEPEVEALIGLFTDMLVLRMQPRSGDSFLSLLTQARATAHEAYTHQGVSFQELVEELRPTRDLSRSPLFETLLGWHNEPASELVLEGLEARPFPLAIRAAQHDLSLDFFPDGDGLRGQLDYDVDLFDATTIARLADQLCRLMAAFVERPEQAIGDPSLLTPAAQHQLSTEWNDSARTAGRDLETFLPHRALRHQARRRPEAPAIEAEGERRSYRQLADEVERITAALIAAGVGPETRVAILMQRGIPLVSALLGVLEAGGAYLPLDPSHPSARLRAILDDAQPRLMLTEASLAERFADSGVPYLAIEDVLRAPAADPPHETHRHLEPARLAYVIYTSGSTGKPKGVQISLGAMANFLAAMARRPGLTSSDTLLAVTTVSFDIAVLELFLPLVCGARTVVADRETTADAGLLAQALEETAATTMQATPATWQLLLDSGWRGETALRVLCGGEALSRPLADRLLAASSDLFNLYGPTETTVWSTVARLRPQGGPIHVGVPIDNTEVQILDRRGRPVTAGVIGELCLGGDGLARGYLGRPSLTADRFVPQPSARRSGARLYRTGDLARWRADGTLEHVGRIDHQVKVRGYRIELGEIEAVLERLPAVRQAVVVARGDGSQRRMIAYLVARPEPDAAELRRHLREELPEYMVPSRFVTLDALPLNTSGKVDRQALPDPAQVSASEATYVAPRAGLEQEIARVWSDILAVPQVGLDDNFFDLGGHSLLLPQVREKLRPTLQRELNLVDLFSHPTVRLLARFARPVAEPALRPTTTAASEQAGTEIAIVGMAGRFPGAETVDELWANLLDGVESVSFFSEDELRAVGVDEAQLEDPAYVRARGILDGIEDFDAALFGIAPREAEAMDPQHRVFLEICWQALEDAGHTGGETIGGKVGVYAGAGMNTYLLNHLAPQRATLRELGTFQWMIGNDKDFLSTRVSYKLGLRGPSVSIQTACSTSLVAVSMACRDLLSGACDMALAGGVSIDTPQIAGYFYQEGGILSPDGRCRPFDANAQGTVCGNGAGVVALRRLADARADGDRVIAVIRGFAVNNDGDFKIGYTAPSVEGQSEVIRDAQAMAGVTPKSITYLEAHGTGTSLGDAIEVEALRRVFANGDRAHGAEPWCALGSVKANVGHLDTAAGVVGLIKTALALKHRVVPPNPTFTAVNPKLSLEDSPFFVSAAARPWELNGSPRRAGVSSFGIGGTNAHMVLEEAETTEPVAENGHRSPQLLILSAGSRDALDTMTDRLATHLRHHPALDLRDVAYTLQTGRRVLEYRRSVCATDLSEAARIFGERDPQGLRESRERDRDRPVVFLFPGQGSQYAEMGAALYRTQPRFAHWIDRGAEQLEPLLGFDLRSLLLKAGGDRRPADERLAQTAVAQPALFVIEHALAQLWMSWGIEPEAMLGHSLGEYVAATVAGVFEPEDALRLVALRGRLMQAQPEGRMLSVRLGEDEIRTRLTDDLELAAVNNPTSCVVAGPPEAFTALEERLAAEGIEHRALHTSHAFHSRSMEPVLEPFRDALRKTSLEPPRLPYVSNITGTWIRPEEACDPEYWARHLRHTVRFSNGVATLLEQPARVLLEVGPGRALSTLARRRDLPAPRAIATSMPPASDRGTDELVLSTALADLWLCGVDVRWGAIHRGRRVALPLYSFDRHRCWIEAPERAHQAPGDEAATKSASTTPETSTKEAVSGQARPPLTTPFLAPQNDRQRQIATVWQRQLGLAEIGVHDDFFELGGHSLAAVQLTSKLTAALGRTLSPADLFTHPTVAALATLLDDVTDDDVTDERLEVKPDSLRADVDADASALSFVQDGVLQWERAAASGQAPPQPNIAFAWRLCGAVDPLRLAASVTAIARRHEILHTVYTKTGRPRRISPTVAPRTVDLRPLPMAEREAELQRLAVADAHEPFDLIGGPVLRVTLIYLEPDSQALLLSIHRIAADGWSVDVFTQELAACYERPDEPLPTLPTQYGSYAASQRGGLTDTERARLEEVWHRRLGPSLPRMHWPGQDPDSAIRSLSGARQHLELPRDLSEALKTTSQSEGVTLFMTLLAGFAVLLSRLTGQRDLVVGTIVSDRDETTKPLIGRFLNTVLIRVDLTQDPSFRELLRRIREASLDAFAHQAYPFELLAERHAPEAIVPAIEIVQAMLVVHAAPVPVVERPGFSLAPMRVDRGTADQDLSLALVDEPEGFEGYLEYRTELFNRAAAMRMAAALRAIYLRGVADPALPMSQLVGEDDLVESLSRPGPDHAAVDGDEDNNITGLPTRSPKDEE